MVSEHPERCKQRGESHRKANSILGQAVCGTSEHETAGRIHGSPLSPPPPPSTCSFWRLVPSSNGQSRYVVSWGPQGHGTVSALGIRIMIVQDRDAAKLNDLRYIICKWRRGDASPVILITDDWLYATVFTCPCFSIQRAVSYFGLHFPKPPSLPNSANKKAKVMMSSYGNGGREPRDAGPIPGHPATQFCYRNDCHPTCVKRHPLLSALQYV
jgi:hypothetical protein